MDTGRISARYAKALYEYAVEKKQDTVIYEEMKLLSDSLFAVPEINKALLNPVISTEKKKELLITAAGTDVCPEFKRFLDLVVEKRREAYFHFISLVYQDVYRKANNIVIGKLSTATPVEAKEEERLRKIVSDRTKGQVDFQTIINPDLVGGFILQVGTYQLDASISSQLKDIKDQLLKKNSILG
ncbi:MAG: F0F1 ATP synthase subunit delta [Paludibacteraceae bacterium]|nr:F0F1 ATP synthase subunit delta [Paludibacteraceae bacterium]